MSHIKLFTIPNFATLLNLISGLFGILFCFKNQIEYASYCMFISATFDFIDGFVARLFKSSSELGKQLDSLCDVVSFGVLPGFMLYNVLVEYKEIALIIPVFSALRLAKFNIDERQTEGFIGVPTPINAFFLISLSLIFKERIFNSETNYLIMGLIIGSSILLVSEIPLFSLKVKNSNLKENWFRFALLALSLLFFAFWRFQSFFLVYIGYILISILNNFINKRNVIHSRN